MQLVNYYLELVLRTVCAFVLLLVCSRLIGQKFSIVSGIVVGTILGLFTVASVTILNLVTVLLSWVLLTILCNLLRSKSIAFSQFVSGKPTILIEQGKILDKNVQKSNTSIPDMMSLLRSKDAFKVADVELGVLEPGGELTVMKKSSMQPISPSVLGRTVEAEHTPKVIIAQGQVVAQTMEDLGLSYGWLLGEIMKQGANSYSDVFFAQIDSKGNVYVDLYKDSLQPPVVKQRALLLAILKKIEADLQGFALATKNQNARKMYEHEATKLAEIIDKLYPYLTEA